MLHAFDKGLLPRLQQYNHQSMCGLKLQGPLGVLVCTPTSLQTICSFASNAATSMHAAHMPEFQQAIVVMAFLCADNEYINRAEDGMLDFDDDGILEMGMALGSLATSPNAGTLCCLHIATGRQ